MALSGGYLFVTFAGEGTQGEEVYFSLSTDGLHWKDLNQGRSILRSRLGEQGVRDPFILRSPEDDMFYMIATDLWIGGGTKWEDAVRQGSRSILVWESRDLIHWTKERLCQIAPENAGCAWAPEAVYDPDRKAYMIFWASFVKGKHRIFRAWTSDFRSFTPPELYFQRVCDVIDMTIIRFNGEIYRFYKDETEKYICMDCGPTLDGPFKRISSPSLDSLKGVEGPAAFQLRTGELCLLADQFASGKGYCPLISSNNAPGEFRILDSNEYDMGQTCKRHGSVLALSDREYDRMQKAWPK
ncbi:MAG TPA: glycoside hydrolase family 43 protein [Candidatus Dorea merdavium]|nr:glycoside hydrolase family 43 protein [Candidatus Dorea merdavium]